MVRRVGVVQKRFEKRGAAAPSPKSAYDLWRPKIQISQN